MTKWKQAAAYAAENVPRIIGNFGFSVLLPPAGMRSSIAVDFKLSCKSCRGAVFRIYSFPKIAPDPSPYYGVAPGEIFLRPPHYLGCVGCGERNMLFDARTDGYDGVLNGGCSYESGEEGEAPESGEYTVEVSLMYNGDFEELVEAAEEVGVTPADLFDAISINGTPVNEGPVFAEVYECA